MKRWILVLAMAACSKSEPHAEVSLWERVAKMEPAQRSEGKCPAEPARLVVVEERVLGKLRAGKEHAKDLQLANLREQLDPYGFTSEVFWQLLASAQGQPVPASPQLDAATHGKYFLYIRVLEAKLDGFRAELRVYEPETHRTVCGSTVRGTAVNAMDEVARVLHEIAPTFEIVK
jgi:hypothetical protein